MGKKSRLFITLKIKAVILFCVDRKYENRRQYDSIDLIHENCKNLWTEILINVCGFFKCLYDTNYHKAGEYSV